MQWCYPIVSSGISSSDLLSHIEVTDTLSIALWQVYMGASRYTSHQIISCIYPFGVVGVVFSGSVLGLRALRNEVTFWFAFAWSHSIGYYFKFDCPLLSRCSKDGISVDCQCSSSGALSSSHICSWIHSSEHSWWPKLYYHGFGHLWLISTLFFSCLMLFHKHSPTTII